MGERYLLGAKNFRLFAAQDSLQTIPRPEGFEAGYAIIMPSHLIDEEARHQWSFFPFSTSISIRSSLSRCYNGNCSSTTFSVSLCYLTILLINRRRYCV